MPVLNDYIETKRKTVTIWMDAKLYQALKQIVGTVNSPSLRMVFSLYLQEKFSVGSKQFPDRPGDRLEGRVVTVAMNMSDYEAFKACADKMRKPLAPIVRAALREVCLDVMNPYREMVLDHKRESSIHTIPKGEPS